MRNGKTRSFRRRCRAYRSNRSGVQYGLQEFFRNPDDIALAKLNGNLEGKKIIVQGLGSVGYHAAKFLQEEDGAKVIAILERDGALLNENGLNVEEVFGYKKEHGKVEGFRDGQFFKGERTARAPLRRDDPRRNGRGD